MRPRRVKPLPWAAGLALVLLAAPSPATTVEEVIEKHVEARGGRDAWNAIETMKLTGDFTAFSKVAPFTLHRKRDDKYHLDHMLGDKPVTIGFDGEVAWWINLWFDTEWPLKIGGPDRVVLDQNLDFASPFFDWQARGYRVELLGEGDLDGQKAIRIQLLRGDAEETWYLDPETYLELGFDAQGSDFGNPMPQRTYFDDFREVGGVMIPHFVEAQWYTRDRIMEVADVELNVEVDDAMFAYPLPAAMARLQPMAGDWKVEVEYRQSPQAPWQKAERTAAIGRRMLGLLLEEAYTDPTGTAIARSLSYDRFKETYRLATINDFTGHLDIQEGTFDDDGRLTVSNAETGTTWQGFGFTFHSRTSFFEIGEDGFKTESEQSIDGGENWFVAAKATYSRGE